jgi:hypothetical protein
MAVSEAQKRAFHKYYEKTKERDREKASINMKQKYNTDEEYRRNTIERAKERYRQNKLLKLQENENKIL